MLSINIPEISQKILSNKELLEKLFSFLLCDTFHRERTPDEVSAAGELPTEQKEPSGFVPGIRVVQLGFCAKIFASLMKTEEFAHIILEFLISKEGVVSRIANRADQPEVNEFIFKLITIQDCEKVGTVSV